MTHPYEEHNQMKALKGYNDMLGFVADVECGIPTSCPCGGGGRIINEVSQDPKYQNDLDTLPGRKYFTCINFELINGYFRNDGFHFRQSWVFGVQEEAEKLRKHVNEMAAEIAELKDKVTCSNPTHP
ncbi:BnaC03g75360D [Brassica napus]|uniref:BnaC03g75360D protein n=1 Tax=Brassica napus TaxID=3708 RepID=A0A078IRS1_BRANA|nr:BnaC03g75360D [Brassica napus]